MKTPCILHIYRTYFPEKQGAGQEAIRQLCLATQPLIRCEIGTGKTGPTWVNLGQPGSTSITKLDWWCLQPKLLYWRKS
jgi:hypothetical protein